MLVSASIAHPHPLLHLATLPWTILLPLPPTSAHVSMGSVKNLPAASALHRPIPVYSFPLAPLLLTFFQVPKTLRLDGATREEGKFPLGNQRTGWPGTRRQ